MTRAESSKFGILNSKQIQMTKKKNRTIHRRDAESAEKRVFSLRNIPNSANSLSLW
jgi:hypothetical protein